MIFKHAGSENLANPVAIFIILVGTVGAVLNVFPLSDAKNAVKLFGKIFMAQKQRYTNVEII